MAITNRSAATDALIKVSDVLEKASPEREALADLIVWIGHLERVISNANLWSEVITDATQ